MTGVEFFHAHLGRHIGVEDGGSVKSARVPQRVKAGVSDLSLGQMDTFYIVAETRSMLIGRAELPDTPTVQFVATEDVSARKFIAEWLLGQASAPFMVGVISKAHPEPSFCVTHHIAQTTFCDTSGNVTFNLEIARQAYQLIKHLPWKTVVAPAIHTYSDFKLAPQENNQKERARLMKLLEKTPELKTILPKLEVRPNSGEYSVLSWANIERKAQE